MPTTKKTATVPAVAVSDEQSITPIVQDENQLVNQDADIDGFISKRQAFIQKVKAICVEGKDFHIIQGKKSLAKGGAEKIASIFHWTAKFEKDTEALEMLGDMKGLVAFKCTLVNGQFVGEGRGAALLSKNSSDPNRTLKMAQKSAFIDGVLRASGLSDFFTQDLEDMNINEVGQTPSYPTTGVQPSPKQMEFIQNLMEQKRVDEAWIMDQGFTAIDKLTGGKQGTASELIEFLKGHIPQNSVTKFDDSFKKGLEAEVIERLSKSGELAIADLQGCEDKISAGLTLEAIRVANVQGKFTPYDWTEIVKVAKEVAEKFNK